MAEHPNAWVLNVNSIGHQFMQPADEKEPFYRVPYDLFGDGAFRQRPDHRRRQRLRCRRRPAARRGARRRRRDRPRDRPPGAALPPGPALLRPARDRPRRRRPGVPAQSDEQYDLIIFALPDSLTLTSQFASLRLESFLFTEEAFAEARARLAPDGALVLYNFYRETWLLRKLAGMLESAVRGPALRGQLRGLGDAPPC